MFRKLIAIGKVIENGGWLTLTACEICGYTRRIPVYTKHTKGHSSCTHDFLLWSAKSREEE